MAAIPSDGSFLALLPAAVLVRTDTFKGLGEHEETMCWCLAGHY